MQGMPLCCVFYKGSDLRLTPPATLAQGRIQQNVKAVEEEDHDLVHLAR